MRAPLLDLLGGVGFRIAKLGIQENLLHVVAGAKRAARAGQDYHPDVVVALGIMKCIGDFAPGPDGAGVHRVWTIDGDGRDRVLLLEENFAVGHGFCSRASRGDPAVVSICYFTYRRE